MLGHTLKLSDYMCTLHVSTACGEKVSQTLKGAAAPLSRFHFSSQQLLPMVFNPRSGLTLFPTQLLLTWESETLPLLQ